ncbi:tetratricopeptide repeat protein, partial [Rhodopirellula baltica]|uniref:tetratricopeptide repeat protein n=1 Tax=Rhodopirellula baltica TaxID=265606 RepID=UPI000564322E
MQDVESWEDHCCFHERRDYAGLVAYCRDEVKRSPDNLYAAERLLQALVLNGDYGDAINVGATLERRYPGVGMFANHILDALFALGKTEADFDWAEPPSIVRFGHG